jgi:hypothetical protein
MAPCRGCKRRCKMSEYPANSAGDFFRLLPFEGYMGVLSFLPVTCLAFLDWMHPRWGYLGKRQCRQIIHVTWRCKTCDGRSSSPGENQVVWVQLVDSFVTWIGSVYYQSCRNMEGPQPFSTVHVCTCVYCLCFFLVDPFGSFYICSDM